IAPVIATFWFTVVGGTGIFQELDIPGSVSMALDEAGPPAAMMAIAEQLPFGVIFGFLFLLATIIFVLTTTDFISLTISMKITDDGNPPRSLISFFTLIIGKFAIVIVSIGESSINTLQSFNIVTAMTVVILVKKTNWTTQKVSKDLYEENKEK